MKIFVRTKPKSKKEYIKKIDENHFVVAVKAIPEKGKANEAMIKAISLYFKKNCSSVKIISGQKSKLKIVEF
ncbi:MAG: DUF167 domain-containing protein [Candidatus Nealsonbacteria bacterium]|nr:DUF167 domain-containing protein [Candidatus Nealsonbacteria bacterium]